MNRLIRYTLLLLFSMHTYYVHAQVSISGVVTDVRTGDPIDLVTVVIAGTNEYTETDEDGRYELVLEEAGRKSVRFSRIGYQEAIYTIQLRSGSNVLDAEMTPVDADIEVTITETRAEQSQMVTETTEALKLLPTTTGNLESVLPHIALGARSGTGGELSSQYNVRGGNYDENLVYVNDFEIFRPQLIRSGQQEGLSFPNIDLIRDLSFSSGGYETKYGDKMASVLDIRYKRPEDFKGSISGSLLGGSMHVEGSQQVGSSDYQKFRYLVGARYKTTRYILGSLDTQGEYTPDFIDIQGYLTYDITRDLQVGLLSNYNESDFSFVPRSRATALGLIDLALQLSSVFEGSESDLFKTGMVGGSLTYLPDREKNPLFLKLLASGYRGVEEENIDIIGYYRLSQVETDLNSDNHGEEVAVLGVGTEHDYARNRLYSKISNVQLRGGIELQSESAASKTHFVQFGLKCQREYFDDRLNEWERIDSAGYSLPFSETQVLLNSVLKTNNLIESNKITGYLQDTYTNLRDGQSELSLTVGSRFSYWDLSDAFTVSPRFQLLYRPMGEGQSTTYKLAGGIYYQTPLYRELRRPDGSINNELQPQRSFHLVAGINKDFYWESISDKPFKFITEVYYKNFSDLISYDIDNVRLRYSGENDASGYAVGMDMRLNGEFVPGAESWINFSLLRTRESLDAVEHQRYTENGLETVSDVPRPTDQSFNMSVYFQDYLPMNENMKVYLNMTFGSGLPFGLPDDNTVFRNIFRFRAYRRVDMGFGFQLWKKDWRDEKPNHLFSGLDNAWINLEVFNLMGIENVSSNTWVRTVFRQQYAVPNNLTNRRINLRFRIDF